MDQKQYIVNQFENLLRNIMSKLKRPLKITWKTFKEMDAEPEHYHKIGKALFYMANQLEREGEKWLNMK